MDSAFPTTADYFALSVFAARAGLALETLTALAGLALADGFLAFDDLDLLRVASREELLDFELGCRLGFSERFGGFEAAFLVGLGIPEWSGRFNRRRPVAACVRAVERKAWQRLRGDQSNQGLLSVVS